MEKRDKKYRAFLIFFAKKLCKNSLKSEQKNIFFLHIVYVQFERRCCCDKRSSRASKNN